MSDPSPHIPVSDRALRRGLIGAAILVTGFIVYGSLFPFVFHPNTMAVDPGHYLLSTWHDWDGRGDLLSNILLYLPFGFFTTNALPLRVPSVLRALLAILAGAALSISMEMTQFYDVGRVTSMGDVYANAIGASAGAIAATIIGATLKWPFTRELAERPDAALLLVMFLGYRLYPYVPVIDLHKYWHVMTNNPDKLAAMSAHGIEVAGREAHLFAANGINDEYLATKASRFGHMLD